MLLTRFIPKSPEDEILKGMGVVRHIDGDLHSMIHPPEESINPEGEDHPAFHHDGQGNLLPAETGAHPIDGVIKMLDSRLEEYRAALSERAQQGDETAARLLQDLQGWSGSALVDEAIQLHNQKHPNQPLPPKESPEYRKNTIDIYPDRDKKGNVRLNDDRTIVNYWSNKGIPSGKDPGYGYESGAIHFGPELHDILNNSAFMQAVRYLAQTGTSISGMNERTPPEMLTSQAHLQQDMGRNYINPHLLSSHPGHELHRFPTRKSGKLDMSEMAGRFGFEDQMHHPEGLHASQIMHHLPYEFFSKDGRAMNTESIAKEITGIMQHPDALNHFSQIEVPGGGTLADYNNPEGISALAEYISRKPATKLLFGGRGYTQGKSEDGRKKGSQVYNMVQGLVNSLDEEGMQKFHAHKQSMGQSASHRGITTDIAALANVFGPHADSGDRAHFHANTDNHDEENDARLLIEHLARGHMIANSLGHHTPRPEQPTGVPHYDATQGVPYEQLVGSHNRNLAEQGVYGHSPPAPAPAPVPKGPAQLDLGALRDIFREPTPQQVEMARRSFTGEPIPDGTLGPWMKTTSVGWDKGSAMARVDDLRKFWKFVR